MVNFLLGQQGGYIKYPCFLCLWDSRIKIGLKMMASSRSASCRTTEHNKPTFSIKVSYIFAYVT